MEEFDGEQSQSYLAALSQKSMKMQISQESVIKKLVTFYLPSGLVFSTRWENRRVTAFCVIQSMSKI